MGKDCTGQAPALVVNGWSAAHHLEERRVSVGLLRLVVLGTPHPSGAVAIPLSSLSRGRVDDSCCQFASSDA